MTAAAAGAHGQVRRDPFAMLPFCGYHMASYFDHWLKVGREIAEPPLMFGVNWFRKGEDGKFLWPGFADNMRVLKWIVGRVHGTAHGVETALGWMPRYEDIDFRGLDDFSPARFEAVATVDKAKWRQEILSQEELFMKLFDRLPKELTAIRTLMQSRMVD
jgi:phosphoenolpyruvate carboxykinase (GTP)